MTRHPSTRHRIGTACLLGLVLLAVLAPPASATATLLDGGVGQVAAEPPTESAPVGNVTDDPDDPDDTVSETVEDTDDTVSTVVDDASDTVSEPVDDASPDGSVRGTVEDTVETLENETPTLEGPLETEVNDTLGSSDGDGVTGPTPDDGSGRNGSLGGSDAGGGTGDAGTSTGGSVGPPAGADGGPTPSRGGGLPATAGGVVALGAVAATGAALLQRSAGLGSWGLISSGRLWWSSVAPPGWLRWLAGLVGYSRYDDSDPLEHDTRAELHRRIEGAPGQYLSALADEVDLPLSTARHHLRVLEAEGLIEGAKIRGKRCYFPPSSDHRSLQAALANDAQASVLQTLAEDEGATVSDVATALGVDPSTATDQLQRLATAGLVERERDGRAVRNRLASHVEPVFVGAPAD